MPKNDKAREKKVNVAVKALMRFPGMRVREAMHFARFSKKEIDDVNVRRIVSRRQFRATEAAGPPKNVHQHDAEASLDVSSLSEEADIAAANATIVDEIIPPPKRIKQRMTACAMEKKRVEDRKQKKHRSDALKDAVRLYAQEKAKPDGLSLRQVQEKIMKKYSVNIHYSTISRYVKEGLVGASPKKMGPPGHISKANYKLLCAALSSFIPMNQMNARAGDNTRTKLIVTLVKTVGITSSEAGKLLSRLLRDTAEETMDAEKLNCAEDRRIRWTTFQNIDLWFDGWQNFLVAHGFGTIDENGELVLEDFAASRIINMDETCISLDGSNGNRGGRPSVTFYDKRFPQLGKATSKTALTTTMISGSSAAGEPLPPHFQFQTSAQTAEAEYIRIECIRYMLDVRAQFGHDTEQSFPISLGLNSKGGMDVDEFYEYIVKSIMRLYPDAAPTAGKWVVIKCDGGPGRLNEELLAYLRFHGYLLYPGVPNTTAVTQETDQSYGPFQSKLRTNLEALIDERLHAEKATTLAPWIVGLVVFGGEDPETGCVVGSAFQEGFNIPQNLNAWAKVGAVPLTRACLQNPKVRRSIGDGTDEQQAMALLIQEHNAMACAALSLAGYNGDIFKLELKPAASTSVVTVAHSQDRIELLSQAKSHGNIYAATGGDHLTSNDMFKSIALKQRRVMREKLIKDKKVRERLERTELIALDIVKRRGGDPSKLTAGDLTALLTWHRVPKVGELNKEQKLAKWGRIMNSLKPPPSYEKWTHEDEVKLEEAQSDVVEMAHTALGHMVALKKKELLLAAREMSQEEFDQLVAARRSEATELGRIGGGGVGAGEHDGGTDDSGSSIFEGEHGAANVSIEAMLEGETDAV